MPNLRINIEITTDDANATINDAVRNINIHLNGNGNATVTDDKNENITSDNDNNILANDNGIDDSESQAGNSVESFISAIKNQSLDSLSSK